MSVLLSSRTPSSSWVYQRRRTKAQVLVQYKLDFTGLSAAGAGRGGARDEEAAGGGGADNKPGGSSSDTAMWQYGMGRRGKGDARRTRVSFLLF